MACHSSCHELSECVSYALHKLQMTDIPLKAEQRPAMEAIYKRQDVFVWLPTGYGKSLCHQVLPFIMDYKQGVVKMQRHTMVSPLLAWSSNWSHSHVNIKFTGPTYMCHFCHYVIISTLINTHAQTVCTRPSPPPILEGLGTRLAYTIVYLCGYADMR